MDARDKRELEFDLLDNSFDSEDEIPLGHEFRTAPLVTCDAFNVAQEIFPQRTLLGSISRQYRQGFPEMPHDKRIYVNTNTPSSALVCGVQGSGKSHTVACFLEGSLMKDWRIGDLPEPLAALVFHFDAENGGRPCEAAYLSEPAAKSPSGSAVNDVTILVSPSNFSKMSRVYASFKNVDVQPLFLAEHDLNTTRMFTLMGCDDIDNMPLYMHTARTILREMGSDHFDYQEFKRQLDNPNFNFQQRAMIKLRTDILDSYIRAAAPNLASYFGEGKLVIVDLTDPFVDRETASAMFDIILGMFVEWESNVGKVVVFDEAHKYLTNKESARLTTSITSLIRQQRHLGTRIVISTQEPTIVPESILGLTSFIICHKFSSPAWCAHLKHHISVDENDNTQHDVASWSDEVMNLRTGEALVFSSGAVGLLESTQPSRASLATLGVGYLRIKTRRRLTLDGGASLMAVDRPQRATTQESSTPPVTAEQLLSRFSKKSEPEISGPYQPVDPLPLASQQPHSPLAAASIYAQVNQPWTGASHPLFPNQPAHPPSIFGSSFQADVISSPGLGQPSTVHPYSPPGQPNYQPYVPPTGGRQGSGAKVPPSTVPAAVKSTPKAKAKAKANKAITPRNFSELSAQFKYLIRTLKTEHKSGVVKPLQSNLHKLVLEKPGSSKAITKRGGWQAYCDAAQQAKIVEIGTTSEGTKWLTLLPPFLNFEMPTTSAASRG